MTGLEMRRRWRSRRPGEVLILMFVFQGWGKESRCRHEDGFLEPEDPMPGGVN